MDKLDRVKIASQSLFNYRLRTFLAMLGIAFGNASLIGVIGIGTAMEDLASEQLQSLGPNILFVFPGSQTERRTSFEVPKTLELGDAEAISNVVPTVSQVAPEINTRKLISYQNKNMQTSIGGVTPDFLTVRSFAIAKGRFLSETDLNAERRVAVIGSEIAEKFFPYQNPLGQKLRVSHLTFEIIGVLKSKGIVLGQNMDTTVYIPLTTLSHKIIGKTSIYGTDLSWISVAAEENDKIDIAKFQISNLLRLRHKITAKDDFSVATPKEVTEIISNITGGLVITSVLLSGISLVVGGIGIMNVMLVSVVERTPEIGLRKAVGATEQDILWQFLLEAVMLATTGGMIGVLVGIGALGAIAAFSPLSTTVIPLSIFLSLGTSSVVGLFFGVFPARRAAKLDPIAALSNL